MITARYFIFLVLLFVPINTTAKIQDSGMHGGSGQHMMGPDYQANKNNMNEMMRDMNQLRDHGSLTPEHQKEMQQMMDQLGDMRHDGKVKIKSTKVQGIVLKGEREYEWNLFGQNTGDSSEYASSRLDRDSLVLVRQLPGLAAVALLH
jgi:hypothetical protein